VQKFTHHDVLRVLRPLFQVSDVAATAAHFLPFALRNPLARINNITK